jgi:hypothetical protein
MLLKELHFLPSFKHCLEFYLTALAVMPYPWSIAFCQLRIGVGMRAARVHLNNTGHHASLLSTAS